jgi:uncharacterized protein (TIGR03435 family)
MHQQSFNGPAINITPGVAMLTLAPIKLNPTRNLLLLTAALLTLAATAVCAQTPATPASPSAAPAQPPIKFDVVVFKRCAEIDIPRKDVIAPPGGDSIANHCQTVTHFLEVAYGSTGAPYLLKGEPAWVDTEAYDFQAKVAPEDVPAWQKMDADAKRSMIGPALVEAFNLKTHIEIQPRPVYNLVVDKGGPKFSEHKSNPNDAPDIGKLTKGEVHWTEYDTANYFNVTMGFIAAGLAARLDRPVVDKTGLTGQYDLTVHPLPITHYDPKSSSVEDTNFAGIIDGVRNLGLRLEPAKVPTNVLIIDHIDRPPTD